MVALRAFFFPRPMNEESTALAVARWLKPGDLCGCENREGRGQARCLSYAACGFRERDLPGLRDLGGLELDQPLKGQAGQARCLSYLICKGLA